MKLEHLALNVEDPAALAAWYVAHVGMRVLRSREDAPFTRFLADSAGQVFLELYRKPEEGIPTYADIPAGRLHLGFLSEDAAADRARLEAAGAVVLSDEVIRDGSRVVTFRDPFGLALQISQRRQRWL